MLMGKIDHKIPAKFNGRNCPRIRAPRTSALLLESEKTTKFISSVELQSV